ncbi:MAG: hypothetical protein QNK37_35425, partial [Acidobacteriota bacterium]|nr:hypothetical protein [Acidobacteriota bacterium]
MDNRIERFAVSNRQGEADYRLFTDNFRRDELFLVTLGFHDNQVGPNLAETVLNHLAEMPGVSGVLTYGDFSDESGDTPPLPFPLREGNLFTGIFSIEPHGDRDKHLAAIMAEAEALAQQHREHLASIQVAGEPVVNTFLNRGTAEVKIRFFPLLTVVTLLVLGLVFRSLGTLLVTALSVCSSLATTAGLMALSGEPLNLITTLIPALVFVLGVAMQVHVLLAMAVHGDMMKGLREKVRPNFLVAATTSIGFASLMTSYVQPIAVMGRYMAIGVWVIFIWTHLTHLGLSVLIGLRVTPPHLKGLTRVFNSKAYAKLIAMRLLLIPALIIIPAGTYALLKNPMESNGLNYFDPDHPIRVRTAFLEANVTGASQLELLVQRTGEPPDEGDSYFPGEEAVTSLEEPLLELDHIRHLFSLYRFSKVIEEAETDLELPEEVLEPFISPDFYRMQLLVDSLDRPAFMKLKNDIEKVVQASGIQEPVILTGTLARVIEIQDYLLASLFRGLILTIGAVVVLLFLLLGKGRHFLVIFLPNLFPLGMMALAMWVLGIPT